MYKFIENFIKIKKKNIYNCIKKLKIVINIKIHFFFCRVDRRRPTADPPSPASGVRGGVAGKSGHSFGLGFLCVVGRAKYVYLK